MRYGRYLEDGGLTLVEILSDNRNADGLGSVQLRAIRTLQHSPFVKDIPNGKVFTVTKDAPGWYTGMWDLERLDALPGVS
jgi:hypothetical protein